MEVVEDLFDCFGSIGGFAYAAVVIGRFVMTGYFNFGTTIQIINYLFFNVRSNDSM